MMRINEILDTFEASEEEKQKENEMEDQKVASPIVKYFAYEHLPEKLQTISKPIAVLAKQMDDTLPPCAEKIAGLRKLLEAKDCLVRASLE